MRVAFGDVWKESLTELSGGQRSLLALSLILALCRCVSVRESVRPKQYKSSHVAILIRN